MLISAATRSSENNRKVNLHWSLRDTCCRGQPYYFFDWVPPAKFPASGDTSLGVGTKITGPPAPAQFARRPCLPAPTKSGQKTVSNGRFHIIKGAPPDAGNLRNALNNLGFLQKSVQFAACRRYPARDRLTPERIGEVPEWSNGPDSKSGVRSRVPWVRIPPSPPVTNTGPLRPRFRYQWEESGENPVRHGSAGLPIRAAKRPEQSEGEGQGWSEPTPRSGFGRRRRPERTRFVPPPASMPSPRADTLAADIPALRSQFNAHVT